MAVSKIPFLKIYRFLFNPSPTPLVWAFCKYIKQLSVWFPSQKFLLSPPSPTFLLPQSALLQSRPGCLKPRFGVRPGIQNNNLNLGSLGNTILHHKTVLTTGVQVTVNKPVILPFFLL